MAGHGHGRARATPPTWAIHRDEVAAFVRARRDGARDHA
jgi:hypothetical protein